LAGAFVDAPAPPNDGRGFERIRLGVLRQPFVRAPCAPGGPACSRAWQLGRPGRRRHHRSSTNCRRHAMRPVRRAGPSRRNPNRANTGANDRMIAALAVLLSARVKSYGRSSPFTSRRTRRRRLAGQCWSTIRCGPSARSIQSSSISCPFSMDQPGAWLPSDRTIMDATRYFRVSHAWREDLRKMCLFSPLDRRVRNLHLPVKRCRVKPKGDDPLPYYRAPVISTYRKLLARGLTNDTRGSV